MIWKRKVLIIMGVLLCIIAAGVVSFMLPKVYRAYSVVEIGTVNRGDKIEPVEIPVDTKTKIEKAFIYRVMEELDIPEEEFPELKIENPKGTRIVEISVDFEDIDQALSILKNVDTLLLNDHKRLVEESKTTMSNDIKAITLKINTVLKENKALLQKLSLLRENRKNIQDQIKDIERRLKELLIEKKRLNLSANPDNTLSMLVFTNEIQENQRYYNELQDKLKFEIANSEVDIQLKPDKKEGEIKELELQKLNLQAKLDNLKETNIIKEPSYLKIPVKPKKKLNVLIAGVIGLMISFFLAFFVEYLERVKEREVDVSV